MTCSRKLKTYALVALSDTTREILACFELACFEKYAPLRRFGEIHNIEMIAGVANVAILKFSDKRLR